MLTAMLSANAHAQMIKQFANSSVKSIDYDEPVSDYVIEEIETYCKNVDIPVTKIDELIDVHMEFCSIRLMKK